jgi:hypothetical protein
MSAEQRRFLIRATLNLVDELVRREIENRHKLEVEAERVPEEAAFQKRTLQNHLGALRAALGSDELPDVAGPLFVDAVTRIAVRQRDDDLRPIGREIADLNLAQLREAFDSLNRDLGAKRHQERELAEHLKALQTRFQEAQRDGNQTALERFWDTLKPTDQYCRIPIAIARFRCPLRQEFEPEAPAAPIKHDLQALAEAAQLEIESVTRGLQPITAAREKLEAEIRRQNELIASAELQRDSLRKQRSTIEQNHTLTIFRAEQATESSEAIEKLEARQKELDVAIEASKGRQEALQDRHVKQIANVSNLYESTMKAFLGNGIEASCKFTREEIDLKADRHGELTSAAIDTLKAIAFDIAALRSGVLESSCHPAFLIFDSPREADMHPTPYQRIFHHLKSLEGEDGNAAFQVILTTTEPPPEVFQNSAELVLQLDASAKEGRLYRTDF